jgi:hypothetical protein
VEGKLGARAQSWWLFSFLIVFVGVMLVLVVPQAALAQEGEVKKPSEIQENNDKDVEEPDEGAKKAAKKEEGWHIAGQYYLKSRSRWSEEDSDWDLYNFFSLTMKDTKKNPKVKLHFDILGLWDLDGKPKAGVSDDFRDIYDTYDASFHGRAYSAYADIFKLYPETQVRIGRQSLYQNENLTFDGGFVEHKLAGKLDARLFYGVPVNDFDAHKGNDFVYGAGFTMKLEKNVWARLELMRSQDDREAPLDTLTDDMLFLSGKYKPYKYLSLYGRFSWIDSHIPGRGTVDRRHVLKALARIPRYRMLAKLTAVVQPVTLKEHTTEFSDFFAAMQEFKPYYQISGYLMKEFNDFVAGEIGCDIRELKDGDDEGALNREFVRPYVTVTLSDLLLKDGEFEMTFEYWDTIDHDILTLDASYTQKFGKKWKGAVGTSYEAYDYDNITLEEKENVRTYFLKLKYEVTKNASLRVKYSYMDDKYDSFSKLELALQLKF